MRRIVFTFNNPPEAWKEWIDLIHADPRVNYCGAGFEVAPSTGTQHLQGLMWFTRPIKFGGIKKLIGDEIHFEAMQGKWAEARDYCQKDGDYYFNGKEPRQGNRGDLDRYRTLAMEDGMAAVVYTANFQQIRVAEKFLTYCEPERDFNIPVTVIWVYGASGVGKTRYVAEHTEDDKVYWKDATKWWDGYDGEDVIVLDDFRRSNWEFTYLLRVLDRYPMRVEFKGGYRQLRATTIYVTSITDPREIEWERNEPSEQLYRRITEFVELQATEVNG